MTILFILVIICFCLILLCPYIDYYIDYRGQKHLTIWYSLNGKRKFINLIGSQ